MLQNFTKGKMAEWFILLIAVVALGLSIGAFVRNPCKNSNFGDSGQCVAQKEFKNALVPHDDDWDIAKKNCSKKNDTDATSCTSTPTPHFTSCIWKNVAGGPLPGPLEDCNYLCGKNDTICVCPDGKKVDKSPMLPQIYNELCKQRGKGPGKCKTCVDTGLPCDTTNSNKKYCCEDGELCQNGTCQTPKSPTETCTDEFDIPDGMPCCAGLEEGQNPFTNSSQKVCMKKGSKSPLYACNQPNHPECIPGKNNSACTCGDSDEPGTCQMTNETAGGQCIPDNSTKNMGGNSKTFSPPDNSETGNGGQKDHDNNDRHSTGFGINNSPSPTPTESPSPSPGPDPDPKNNLPLIIGASVGGGLVLLVILVLAFLR